MKLLVFSDIHGSMPVVERMLSLVEDHNPEGVILLGDMLYHGPRNPLPDGYAPKTAARALARLGPRVVAIRGNCDSEVDSTMLPFPLASDFSWVLDPTEKGLVHIFATHGHVFNHYNIPHLQPGDVLLYGHTHVPKAEISSQDVYLCNPGSLALPKEGHPPCYGMFEDGVFSVLTENGEVYRRVQCVWPRQGSPSPCTPSTVDNPSRLETKRLILRQWQDSDYPAFAAMSQDPEVMKFLPELPDREASDAYVNRLRTLIDQTGWGLWAVERKKDNAFLGFVGLWCMGAHIPLPLGVEIGWRLNREAWGNGYATEAAAECLRFGFTELGLPEIVAYAALANKRSRAVMKRLGMRLTDTVFEHPAHKGEPHALHCVYRLKSKEWEEDCPAGQ